MLPALSQLPSIMIRSLDRRENWTRRDSHKQRGANWSPRRSRLRVRRPLLGKYAESTLPTSTGARACPRSRPAPRGVDTTKGGEYARIFLPGYGCRNLPSLRFLCQRNHLSLRKNLIRNPRRWHCCVWLLLIRSGMDTTKGRAPQSRPANGEDFTTKVSSMEFRTEDREDLAALVEDFFKQLEAMLHETVLTVDAALHNAGANIEAAPVQGPVITDEEYEPWS